MFSLLLFMLKYLSVLNSFQVISEMPFQNNNQKQIVMVAVILRDGEFSFVRNISRQSVDACEMPSDLQIEYFYTDLLLCVSCRSSLRIQRSGPMV